MPLAEAVAAVQPYAEHLTRGVDEVATDLQAYAEMLAKWQHVQNLVSRETLGDLWVRHIADSLQVLRLIRDEDARFLDLGSGGGLPAIPLAVARRGRGTFRLIEPTGRKASFLRSVGRDLGLDIEVQSVRAEQIDSRETFPDVITARALARLPELLGLSAPLFGPETRGIFHKGRDFEEELTESRAHWRFDVLVAQSDTNPGSVLLEIRNPRANAGS